MLLVVEPHVRPANFRTSQNTRYYPHTMPATLPAKPRALALMFGWRRLRTVLFAAVPLGLLFGISSETPTRIWLLRAVVVGLSGMVAFGAFERWPARVRGPLPRWAVQLICLVVAVPFGAYFAYWLTTGGSPQFSQQPDRISGYFQLVVSGVLFGPWIALAALVRHRDGLVRDQALAFALERSELERQALDARLRLLQAQVEPHFLFNTLANVRELVDAGSPQASSVLDSLIAYLRAAVPRLHDPATTLGQELQLVRAYLEIMHMRIPDRLQFSIDVGDRAGDLRCPPMTLLTLVENAVRHGIDPSEEGGRIDVIVRTSAGRCRVQVIDTGVGLQHSGDGLGTGLASLRERLQLVFGGDARVDITAIEPHGARADLDFPAQRIAA